jgi:UPF0755 protein
MKQAAKVVLTTLLLFLGAAAGVVWWAASYPGRALGGPATAKITVEKGNTLGDISRRLSDRGIISHPSWFRLYANERGLAQKIRAGQYTLTASMTPKQILDKLVEGVPVEEVSVTIPEGKNLLQIAELLDGAGVTTRDDAEKAARDSSLARQLGVPGDTLEGYLYPDTYRFRPGTPASKALSTMVKHGQEVYATLKAKHKAGFDKLAKQYKFGDREVVLMASLVEKETAQPEERPRIAGVFLNRLRLPTFVPHLLQTDPTIVYGCTVPTKKSAACKKFEGRIRKIQLEDKDNPFNTYTHEGLPPGPISNPGRAALEAVLQPDETPFLYFVSKNDGTHYFSKTRAEHEAAVDKYQRHGGSDSGS